MTLAALKRARLKCSPVAAVEADATREAEKVVEAAPADKPKAADSGDPADRDAAAAAEADEEQESSEGSSAEYSPSKARENIYFYCLLSLAYSI